MSTTPTSAQRLARIREAAGGALLRIAHRGARAFAPENTLPAFERARELGCHMIELDVHLSADGRLVVHHDDTLTRCTDVLERFPSRQSYFVSDFTWKELRSLDAGRWYVEQLELEAATRQPFLRTLSNDEIGELVPQSRRSMFGSGQVRLPLLDEVLAFARSASLLVNIEIKSLPRLYPEIAAAVVSEVVRFGATERVLVSSFDHEQLLHVRALDTWIPTAVLSSDRLARLPRYLEFLDADAYHPGCYGDFDSLGFGSMRGVLELGGVDAVLQSGRDVNVWTCNDPAEMARLVGSGVSGVMTDYPNRLAEVLPHR